MRSALVSSLFLLFASAAAPESGPEAVLPPELPWDGRSRSLLVDPSHPWATPFERSGLARSPSYDETVAWLRRLEAAAPELRLLSLGKSPEGRDLWMAVASRERAFTPESARATGKPILLVQAGIHAGEIDGKDAGMMLLRDATVRKTRADLLDAVQLLFVPIFNVDGHERSSPRGRINQRGPAETGWRTTSRNLNLNRDYAKLDAPETRALVRCLDAWRPDLYVDVHVTDGADYQYDVTYGHNGASGLSPGLAGWLDGTLLPALDRDLAAAGHVPGPLIQLVDDKDPRKGIVDWTAGPRFSTGYGDARHLATVLVENHSLKLFERRVLGTYVLLESASRTLGREFRSLRAAAAEDERRRPERLPVDWKLAGAPTGMLHGFKGVAWRLSSSPVSGADRIEWLGTPVTLDVPRVGSVVSAWATRAEAYWIPPAWSEVIERLETHGIRVERIDEPREVDVEMYRVEAPKLAPQVFEGHVPVSGSYRAERRRERLAAGSARVSTDQPLGELAALLLEPGSADSFFRWGFFLEPLQRTEYVEAYVMEPTAERMLIEDPMLRAEFQAALSGNPVFAADPDARLRWFYLRTRYADERHSLYPVSREIRPAPPGREAPGGF